MDLNQPTEITPAEATAALHQAGAAALPVAYAGSGRYASWLTGLAACSALYVFTLGLFPLPAAERSVLAVSIAFAVLVGALALITLPGARASRSGFSQRFGFAMGAWGLLFGVALGVGLAAFPGQPAFFTVAALAVPVPLLLGARLELRGGSIHE